MVIDDKIHGQIENKQKAALQQNGLPKTRKPFLVLARIFGPFGQVQAAQHIAHIQARIQQESLFNAVLVFHGSVQVQRRRVGPHGTVIAKARQAEVYHVPAHVHLVESLGAALAAANEQAAHQKVAHRPAAQHFHRVAVGLQAFFIECEQVVFVHLGHGLVAEPRESGEKKKEPEVFHGNRKIRK